VLSLWLVLLSSLSLSMSGFPDGSRTPYDRATEPFLGILTLVCFIQGLYFIFLSFRSAGPRAFSFCLMLFLSAFLVIAPLMLIPDCPRLTMCRQIYETVTNTRIDDGEGG
jgi:hypothetical protein